MAEKKNDDKSISGLNDHLASLNQNAGLQKMHSKRIADLTRKRNQMAARATGLSEAEAGRRQKYEADMKASQKIQEEAIKAGGKTAPKAMEQAKIQAKMKKKEDRRIAIQQYMSLQGIGKKLGNLATSVGGTVKATGKNLLKGIGVIALFAFLQSDMFKRGVKFLVEFISEFASLLDPKGKVSLGLNKATAGLALAVGFLLFKIIALGLSLYAQGVKLMATGPMKAIASGLSSLATGLKGIGLRLMATGPMQAIAAGASSMMGGLKRIGLMMLVQGKVLMVGLMSGASALLAGFTAFLIPLLPIIAIVAAVAAVAYAIVRIFQGFQEYFSEANEQFGFFGGILAGFTGGIKMILGDIVGVIDSILGFFGFPDLMDPIIKAIEEFDVMNFVSGIVDFFSNLGNIIMESLSSFGKLFKAIGAGAIAAIKSPFSPIESFNKAFDEVMSGGEADSKPNLGNIAKAGAEMSGGDEDSARFVARKENEDMMMKRKEEMMGDKRAVTINNNNVSKGGDNYSEVRGGDVNVHDSANDPYTNMT